MSRQHKSPNNSNLVTVVVLTPDGEHTVLPLRLQAGIPVVSMRIGAVRLDAQIDSGGGGLTLPESYVEHLKFVSDLVEFENGKSLSTLFAIRAATLEADDLLAQNVMKDGLALIEAIKACPHSFTPLDIMRETVLSVAKHTVTHHRTRQVIEISQRSASAMQAHMSRLIEVEASVAAPFAERIEGSPKDELESRLLAAPTLSAMNVAILSWYRGDSHELVAAVEQVFSRLARIVCDQTGRGLRNSLDLRG